MASIEISAQNFPSSGAEVSAQNFCKESSRFFVRQQTLLVGKRRNKPTLLLPDWDPKRGRREGGRGGEQVKVANTGHPASCVRMYTHTHTHTHIHTHIMCQDVHVCVCMYVCRSVCVCVCRTRAMKSQLIYCVASFEISVNKFEANIRISYVLTSVNNLGNRYHVKMNPRDDDDDDDYDDDDG